MAEIYLLRHGEAEHNLTSADTIGGRSSHAALTPLGHQQSYDAGMSYTKQEVMFDKYVSSTALRARQTAYGVLKAMDSSCTNVTTYVDLEEMTQGVADGKPRHAIYTPEVKEIISLRGLNFAIPGAESVREIGLQGLKRIKSIADEYPNATILVVTHGLRIRASVGLALGWNHAQIMSAETPNCSSTHLTVTKDTFTLHALGEDIAQTQQ